MKSESRHIIILSSLLLLTFIVAGTIRGSNFSQASEDAFAAIGPALVKGNFHQYPPFYDNVISPHAVVAKAKVYCTFQNTKGQPVVMAYDITKKSWDGPVYASEFGLGQDAHGNPSICIDAQGYIHIFFGCHGKAMRHTRSAMAYDITRWQEQPEPTEKATYPQSMRMADGRIFLFYRAGGHMEPWSMRISSDNCQTWSKPEKIIEMRLAPLDPLAAAYCSFSPGNDGRTVHCFWVHKDDNARHVKGDKKHPWRPLKYKGLHEAVYRYNMYYIYRDAEGTWRCISGRQAELPVSKAFADKYCLVHDSADEFTNIGFGFADNQNRPYVRFRTGVGDWKKGNTIIPWRYKYAHYAHVKWHVYDEIPKYWPDEAQKKPRQKAPLPMEILQRETGLSIILRTAIILKRTSKIPVPAVLSSFIMKQPAMLLAKADRYVCLKYVKLTDMNLTEKFQ